MIRSQMDAVESLLSALVTLQEPLLISYSTADDHLETSLTNARLRPNMILVMPQKWSGAFVRRLLANDWQGEHS